MISPHRITRLTTVALLAIASTAYAETAKTDAQTIAEAIESYTPAWESPEGELAGMVVALNPLGGGADSIEQRSRDDLALYTTTHLHHLLRHAGAKTVVMRVDDRVMNTDEQLAVAEIVERCEKVRAHLLLSITYDDMRPSNTDASMSDLTATLAQTLSASEGVDAAESNVIDSLDIPTVVCHLKTDDATRSAAMLRRIHAENLYRQIKQFTDEYREQLEAGRAGNDDTTSDETGSSFVDARTQRRKKLEQFAKSLWPEGDLPLEKAPWFAEIFKRLALSDRTAIHYEPVVTIENGRVIINGETSSPVLQNMMVVALKAVGIKSIINNMRLLPDLDLQFGACRTPMARTVSTPSANALPQTQLLFGEPVYLLDRQGDFMLAQAGDGYFGWVKTDAIELMTCQQFNAYTSSQSVHVIHDIEQDTLRIPRGARLPLVAQGDKTWTVKLPDGQTVAIAADHLRLTNDVTIGDEIARAALTMLQTPYVFGGRSPMGIDCSGLVTNLYSQQGLPVARDAGQQFISGRLVATAWHRDGIRPGDRLYFINESGKIFHTGIALTATHFIHAAPPEVQISSLVKGDRLYDEELDKAFIAAKRP